MLISKKQLSVFVMSGLAVFVLAGCATKSYVRKQVAVVDNKVTTLSATVAENSERLDATDGRARQGIADAAVARNTGTAAQASANQAQASANAAQSAALNAQSSADSANQGAQNANNKATTIDGRLTTLENSIDRYYPGPTTVVMFKAGRSELSQEGMQALDELVAPISSLERGYRVEIQGFASSEGKETMNLNLSQERSEAVQRYLVGKGADLIRITIVGLGVERPVADNNTRKGREQNRRAEIRVFSAGK